MFVTESFMSSPGCKIKDLRARTNTYIKTPMRTQSPVFVVTGKEEAVLLVMEEIQHAAEHFTHIRASRNHHKAGGGLDVSKTMSREGDVMIQVTVPYRVVGLVVGLKGQTIKAIQQETDTFIVTPNRDKAPIFEIRGQPENVERAKMMILRHIETRTKHCRLQDTTNLPTSWSEDQRQNGNDYSYYHNDTNQQNGHGSSSINVQSNFSNNSTVPNGIGFNSQSTGFNMFSTTSPPAQGNNWRGYGGTTDQMPTQNGNFSTSWSIATSDYNPVLCSVPSLSNRTNNLLNSARSNNSYQFNMSVGSTSSSSNSSSSISPHQEFIGEGSFSSQQLPNTFGASLNSPSLRSISDPTEPSAFTSFPLLTSAPATSTKGSLVLGNLFQSNNVTSNLGMNMLSSMDSMINGVLSLHGGKPEGELNCYPSLKNTSFPGGLVGDVSLFTAQRNGFASGDSSPTSKSCSFSESSGSQSSPTPRLCKICEEADVVAALVPCGHNLFCMECAEGIVNKLAETERKCPVCKDVAADVLRIRA